MAEVFEHGYAIVIGVDDNNIKRLALPTVAKDVQAIYDVLIHPQRCGYKEENVRLLKGSESTRINIIEALEWLDEQVENDPKATAVIYYSGHGMEDKKSNRYYLIPYDIKDLKKVKSYAIEATNLTDTIQNITAKRLLVILDCCHADGMGIKSVDDSEKVKSAAFPLDLPETKEIPELPMEPGAKAVSDLLEGEGRAILNSSTGAQPSFVRKDRKMSLFTYHLIEALTGHAPHADDATVVYVTDVMSWVTHEVKKSAQNDGVVQTPVMRTSGVFPVAQLIGGQGVAKGLDGVLPKPIDPLPPAVSIQVSDVDGSAFIGDVNAGGDVAGGNIEKTEIHQEGQTVNGPQINAGDNAQFGQIGDNINTGGGDYVSGHKGDVVHGDKFTGDKVGGDKVMGDKIGGDNISVGNISGGSGIAIGRGAAAHVNTGDTFNMSGDFRGAMLNIKSTLSDVQQTIGTIPSANDSDKQELQNLVQQLEQALAEVPEANVEDAEAVSQTTEALVNMAAAEKPNKTMLQITGEGLKQAAKNLAAITPDVVTIATSIVMAISRTSGMG